LSDEANDLLKRSVVFYIIIQLRCISIEHHELIPQVGKLTLNHLHFKHFSGMLLFPGL
jgi:hypothetical protein